MESVSTGRQRIEKWDIARGILIFLVVLGHFVAYYAEDSQKMQSLFLFIYAFHMPCFLFIDGMFSKKNVDERRYSRIFSYLVLYFFAKMLIALTQGVINHRMHFSLLEESGLPWYGLVLFACSLLTVFLKRFSRRWVLCASILLACFVGYDDSISDFLALSRVIVYFPFFFLGYCTDPVQLAHWLSARRRKLCSLAIMLLFALLCYFGVEHIYFLRPLLTGRNAYSALARYNMAALVPFGAVCRLVYYPCVLILGAAFFGIVPDHVGRLFSQIAAAGQRSLQIYVLHRPVLYILYDALHFDLLCAQYRISNLVIVPLALLLTWLLSLSFWQRPLHAIIYPKEAADSPSHPTPQR